MLDSDENVVDRRDGPELPPDPLKLDRRQMAREAHAMRAEAMRTVWRLGRHGIVAGVTGTAHWIARRWSAYRIARARLQAAGQLHGLDDRMLQDIGLRRSEIDSAVRGEDRLAPARAPADVVMQCREFGRRPLAEHTGFAAQRAVNDSDALRRAS